MTGQKIAMVLRDGRLTPPLLIHVLEAGDRFDPPSDPAADRERYWEWAS